MRELNRDRLRTLVTIADLGSFAEAARTLHLAPPTVSLHIADLEAHIGAPLLVRKRGEVRPSAVGEVLVERARRWPSTTRASTGGWPSSLRPKPCRGWPMVCWMWAWWPCHRPPCAVWRCCRGGATPSWRLCRPPGLRPRGSLPAGWRASR